MSHQLGSYIPEALTSIHSYTEIGLLSNGHTKQKLKEFKIPFSCIKLKTYQVTCKLITFLSSSTYSENNNIWHTYNN